MSRLAGISSALNYVSTHSMQRSVILLFLSIIIGPSQVAAAPIPLDIGAFLHNLMPEKGGTSITDELMCYSLPYGGIGFTSHVLTYWTILFLGLGRKPLPPFSKLKHSWWDLLLALVTVIITVPLAAFTIVRCIRRWQFVLLAVWKTTMSFTLGIIGLHRSLSLRKSKNGLYIDEESYGIFAWLILYMLGTIVGLTGLLSLIIQTFHDNSKVRIICYVFGGIVAGLGVIAFCLGSRGDDGGLWVGTFSFLAIAIVVGGILAAFYCDWILGAIANNNWAGAPSGDNVWLYWTYFVAKRLPLMSL